MGKPYNTEIQSLPKTAEWAKTLDLEKLTSLIEKFSHPVYIVGSGGSFSACIYAADLLVDRGIFAKAVTPLELFHSKKTIRNSHLIFVSASGKNTDIVFAFKKAIENEPISITSICMRSDTKLGQIASNYSSCSTFEFKLPSGKDGFLATNSLIAYFIIFYRAITKSVFSPSAVEAPELSLSEFVQKIQPDTCFTLLYGAYHRAIAIDLESKFSEAGLAPSLVSDFRHFAHGRHNWFDKNPASAIIALTSDSDRSLCEKTLNLLPEKIPKLILDSRSDGFDGTISMLLNAMKLIGYYGKRRGIDPGKPGVPPYGSKIYNLKYEKLISNTSINVREASIVRKAKVFDTAMLNSEQLKYWNKQYNDFNKKLKSAKFGCLIFDYDGTLCSPENRFSEISDEVKSLLIQFVKKGFVLGVVSGRGKSLRKSLESVFSSEPKLMEKVVVGYYNGSDIGFLSDQTKPNKDQPLHKSLEIIADRLSDIGIKPDISPNQLTFGAKTTHDWISLKETLLNEVMLLDLQDISMVESSHSIDLIPRTVASKNNILEHCKMLCKSLGLSETSLCVGDKGQWPGNDYELLANEYSLSIGEVSALPNTGWNICPVGLRDEKAVVYLLNKLKMADDSFVLSGL